MFGRSWGSHRWTQPLLKIIFWGMTKRGKTKINNQGKKWEKDPNFFFKNPILYQCYLRLKKAVQPGFQRPEGMHRELYNLLYSENKELPCPLIPTDTSKGWSTYSLSIIYIKVNSWFYFLFTCVLHRLLKKSMFDTKNDTVFVTKLQSTIFHDLKVKFAF